MFQTHLVDRPTVDPIKLFTDLADNAIHGKGDTSKYGAMINFVVQNAFNSANNQVIDR